MGRPGLLRRHHRAPVRGAWLPPFAFPHEKAPINELFPVSPADVGIGHGDPDAPHVEGAYLLAQDAEPRLKARGFTADEIVEWARRYVSVDGDGGVDDLIEWIDRHENAGTMKDAIRSGR